VRILVPQADKIFEINKYFFARFINEQHGIGSSSISIHIFHMNEYVYRRPEVWVIFIIIMFSCGECE
jgi:hypothetical protein